MARNKTKQEGARAPIRGYDNWTIGELRQKLARRTPEELKQLLAYEKGGRKRKGALDSIKRVLADLADTGKPARKAKKSKRTSARSSRKGVELGAVIERVREGVQSGMKKVRELVGMGKPKGAFSREAFMDRLSEFLEHERNGAKLYEVGLAKDEITEEQRGRLEEFSEQTKRHIDILSTIIIALGGDPDLLSAPAELNRQKASGLIETDVSGEVGVLNYFQNLMIAEFVDHRNWELLTKMKGKIDDEEVAQVLDEHIENVEDEEDEHYRWAMKQVEDLSVANLFSEGAEERDEPEATEESEVEEEDESTSDEGASDESASDEDESGEDEEAA